MKSGCMHIMGLKERLKNHRKNLRYGFGGHAAEEARRVGVVSNNLHVTQPEIGINISFSDKSDIIEYSVFC